MVYEANLTLLITLSSNTLSSDARYDEYEIVLILEQNIRVFLGLHKLPHGLTFGIIYFCKYYGQ